MTVWTVTLAPLWRVLALARMRITSTTFLTREANKTMIIKFLKTVTAPQVFVKEYCSCCGPERQPAEPMLFSEGEEVDPHVYNAEIDLTGLTYRVDYDIVQYP